MLLMEQQVKKQRCEQGYADPQGPRPSHQPMRHIGHPQRYQQIDQDEPHAVDNSFDYYGRDTQGKMNLGPVCQQVSADHLARFGRQHFVREQADEHRLQAAPEGYLLRRAQNQLPPPCMTEVGDDLEYQSESDPEPVEVSQMILTLLQRCMLEHPNQTDRRYHISESGQQPLGQTLLSLSRFVQQAHDNLFNVSPTEALGLPEGSKRKSLKSADFT